MQCWIYGWVWGTGISQHRLWLMSSGQSFLVFKRLDVSEKRWLLASNLFLMHLVDCAPFESAERKVLQLELSPEALTRGHTLVQQCSTFLFLIFEHNLSRPDGPRLRHSADTNDVPFIDLARALIEAGVRVEACSWRTWLECFVVSFCLFWGPCWRIRWIIHRENTGLTICWSNTRKMQAMGVLISSEPLSNAWGLYKD